jgi:DnaJ family protein C protein 16
MVYTEKTNEEGERFRGEMKQPHISRAATRKMQSFVSIVSGSNYDSFVDRDRWTKNKVMLFNDKKVTPSVYKAHSKKFLGKLDFAETRHTEADLVAKFGIETFPTLLVLTDHESYVGDKYEGEMKPDQVAKFLSKYAYDKPKKVVKLEFLHLDERKYNAGTLCGKKTTELCVLINAGTSEEQVKQRLDELNKTVANFEYDPVTFAYVRGDQDPLIHNMTFGGSHAVIYKPKRKKFRVIQAETSDILSNMVSDSLGGGGEWKKAKTDSLIFG